MKIVLDTNVIVSALLIPTSLPAKILDTVLKRKVTIAYDNRILVEYVDVLFREKFKINKGHINLILDFIKKEGEFILADVINFPFTDEADKKFYEVYKSGTIQYLITGNIRHFPKEAGIVTPAKFLASGTW